MNDRRGFLIRCCEAAGALFFPRSVSAFKRHAAAEFHLAPHYREKTPLDEAVLQMKPGGDGFVSEVRHDRIAGILQAWRADLLQSSARTEEIESTLAEGFIGAGWEPEIFERVQTVSKCLEVWRCRFPQQPSLGRDAFIRVLKASIAGFEKFLAAEFQVTGIDVGEGGVVTQIRYELIGTGKDFFREARIGEWTLQWKAGSEQINRIVRWETRGESRCRTLRPPFIETTERAFGSCSSYKAQMLHGADYWRTVLDGASGIDIYGHNGLAVGDIDGSGRDSVYVCQPAGLPNRLYRNRGDGSFEDVTESCGLGLLDNTSCALFADFDNDGRQDVVVVRANGPLLFLNDGGGKFRLKEGAFHFANPPQGTFTGAAAADYDRDGHLDIYFCLYTFYQGADQYRYPTPYFAAENGPPNFLMHNNGDGTFRDVTAQCGVNQNNTRFSFCCGWSDLNGDGWPDLYVVNDFGRKNLYRNNGNGTFTDIAPAAGVEDVGAGMGVCWLDYDNDGMQDLYVANMWTAAGERITSDEQFQREAPAQIQALYRKHAMGNSLFRNTGQSSLLDVTAKSQTAMGRWAWSSDSWDFDHDGYPDIYVANGMISGAGVDMNSFFWRQVVAKSPNDASSSAEYEQGWNAVNELIRADHSWSGYERNVFYLNHRDGTFSDISGVVGLDFAEDGRAFALADFDGDGRQEMLLKNRNAPQLRLVKNVIADLPPAIAFRLRGTKSNPDAIGARVILDSGDGRQIKLLQAGSGFLSQHSRELFFGLGEAKSAVSATIVWPSGLTQQLRDLPLNHRVSVVEGVEAVQVEPFVRLATQAGASTDFGGESLPATAATWLLCPIAAPDVTLHDAAGKSWALSALRGQPVLLCFADEDLPALPYPKVLVINPSLAASDEIVAAYNLLFRYLFDRHRDLPVPSAFLIDEIGQIVRVYQGHVDRAAIQEDCRKIPRTEAERIARAIPFPGITTSYAFGRNYLSLGSIFFGHGYIDAAAEFFRSALKEDSSSAEAYYGIGSAYLRQNRNEQARQCFEQAVRLEPAYPETAPNAWNNLGLLATRDGDTAKGIDCFQRSLQIDPHHFVTLENLGNAYREQKRWEEARQILQQALAIKPQDAEANYSLGMVYAQLDDSASAYDYLQRALQAKADYPEALNNLGVLYLRTRRVAEAIATFERCIRVAPAFNQSYLNLARVYAIEGDREKARTVLNALLARHPDDKLARQALQQLTQ